MERYPGESLKCCDQTRAFPPSIILFIDSLVLVGSAFLLWSRRWTASPALRPVYFRSEMGFFCISNFRDGTIVHVESGLQELSLVRGTGKDCFYRIMPWIYGIVCVGSLSNLELHRAEKQSGNHAAEWIEKPPASSGT